MTKTVLSPADIAELANRSTPVAHRFPKAGVGNGHHYIENLADEEKPKWEAIFDARALELARDLCLRIGSEYSAQATDGKLGSIKRNRNNWKADTAFECADQIDALMQKLVQPQQ